jgi:hypothetical protein
MKPKQTRTLLRTLCLLLVVSIIGISGISCTTLFSRNTPVPWTVKISKVTEDSVEVDLIGVSRADYDQWHNMKVNKYWPDDRDPESGRLRKAAFDAQLAVTTRFPDGKTFVLSEDDPIWKTWTARGVFELAVVANLTGKFPDRDNPAADPRCRFLKLGRKEWKAKNRTLELRILDGQVLVDTPAK